MTGRTCRNLSTRRSEFQSRPARLSSPGSIETLRNPRFMPSAQCPLEPPRQVSNKRQKKTSKRLALRIAPWLSLFLDRDRTSPRVNHHRPSGRSSDSRIILLSAPSHFTEAKQWLPGFRPRLQRRDHSRFSRDSLLNLAVPDGYSSSDVYNFRDLVLHGSQSVKQTS